MSKIGDLHLIDISKLTGNVGIHYLGLMRDNFGA